jgi:hypothetical protein
MWGESAVIVDGNEITNIARYGAKPVALASVSRDYGRTWDANAGKQPADGPLEALRRHIVN